MALPELPLVEAQRQPGQQAHNRALCEGLPGGFRGQAGC